MPALTAVPTAAPRRSNGIASKEQPVWATHNNNKQTILKSLFENVMNGLSFNQFILYAIIKEKT